MADSNSNPAPRNVSAINGVQGVDITNVGKYDDNTSLDDIAGSYTNVGKQLGQIVNQAAEHVGDIQTKLIGNDFGGTNPYMYNTYYEPGANEIQSDWRVSGTQKALEVGMDRGKKAAEAAAEAAKKKYNDAVNSFNQAVANPTIATLDTSQLGEGNTVDEFIAMNDFSGSRDEVMNRYINRGVIDQVGADWSNKERWKKSANATIEHAGVSQEEYKSWSKEQQDKFWADPKNGTYFSNYFVEDEIKETMGEEALKRYHDSYNSVSNMINKIYDYYTGVTKEIKLEPVKIITRKYGDINEKSQIQLEIGALPGMAGLDSDKLVYEKASSDEWINQNIREDKREEFKKWLEQNRQEHTEEGLVPKSTIFGIGTGPLPGTKYYTIDRNALAEFAKDKLTEDARGLNGQKVDNTVEVTEKSGEEQETSLLNIIRFDIDTLRWYKSMQEEHPETLNVLKNQIAQTYGETSTLEIADGNHYYLINGEYKKPDAGTVILFAAPGVMDNEGNFINKDYETFVDCFKKLNNAAANYSEEERKSLQETMQESWTKYYQSIYMLKIAETYTGGVMNSDMYHAIMYRVDPEKYKDVKVGDKKASDIIQEWKESAEKDGHGTYVKLTQLLNQAFANNGYYYGIDANGDLVQYSLEIGDTGEKTVGQVGDNRENPYQNMSAADAMAIYSIVTTSLQEYQKGNNQDKNINPEFLDDDSSDWGQDFANSAINIFSVMIDIPSALIAAGVAAVGNNFLPEDKRINPWDAKAWNLKDALGTIWPENWGKQEWNELVQGTSWNELFSGAPKKGTLDYFVQFSNLQQQNLADAINPFLVEYWFGKEGDEKNIKRIGEGYTSRTKGAFDLGHAAAFDVYGLNTMFANGTAFRESSARLLGGLVGGYLSGFVTTGYKIAASTAMNAIKSGANALANNLRMQILIHSINNTSNETIASAMGGRIMTQTLEQQAAKSSFGGTAALGSGSNAAIAATAQGDKDLVMRGMTELALNNSKNGLTEGFSTEFLERSLGQAQTSGAVAYSMFTAQQAQAFAAVEETVGKQVAQAIAAETIEGATLSLGTGLPAEAFAAMNSATQKMFIKAYNAVLNGTATATGKINAQAFLQSLGTEGIKEAAVEVAKASTEAAARGMAWTNSDTFRVLSTLGWDGASTRMLLTDFVKDAYIDLVRDNMRNATTPYLTNEGWQRQTVEEYFANPWTYVQNMVYSGIHFGLQRAGAQVKDAYYSKQYDKHLKAYSATGNNPDAQAKEMAKVNQYINKIQMNNDKLMRSGQPYSKLKKSSAAINDDLNYIITKQYEKSGINPITGEMNKKFTSSDEFNDYLKSKKLSTKDRINLANRGMVIETQNNYIMSRYELGGSDKTKLGNIKDWHINFDMQDIEQKTLDKYYDEVIHMNGSILDRQRRMYNLYTQEIMAKYGKTIPGLEASLNNYYGRYLTDLEATLKANPKAQWTLGYTSLAGMTTLSDDSGDVMFGASFGNNFNTVDRNAADVDKSRGYRDIKRQLLDAIKRGDTELKITRADGKEKVYHLNKDGLNYLKTITAYNNSNTVHKYYDPIFGDSVQTKEHKDQVPFAEAAYRSKDAIISSTKVATQAAEADAKAAQETIKRYTEVAYERSKATGEDAILAKRHQDIVDANKTLNVADSDHIYKLSQDRAATERYIQELDAQKHGEMQKRYKEVIPMLSEVNGEIGKIEAQREYRQAVSNTKTAIDMYIKGKLSDENPVFTYKYGENESVKITLDDETLGMIAEAAKNGQEFDSDLTMMMLTRKRNAVPKRVADVNAEQAKGDYTQLIKDLEADTAKTGEDHTATIIKLRREMKENNVRHVFEKRATSGKKGKSTITDYAYKQIKGTPLDTATTGFKIDGEDQLVKYAADDYYYLPKTGQKANPRRAQIVEAATAPIYDFLRSDNGKISVQDERMVAYVVNAAEQNLRNIDTGEDNLRITVGTLKREIMKNAPDADIWMAAKKSGATERLASISKLGAQPEAMIAELKTIIASNSNMPVATKNKFLDTVSLYELISENSNSIKANAYSLNDIVGKGDNVTMKGDLIADVQTLTSGMKNADKYEKSELKRMVTSAGYVLDKLSNPNSKYSSALLKKLSTERIDSSNIAKAVKKDFRTLAYDHYKEAVKNPTPENQAYVDAAFTWAKARYEADPRLSNTDASNIKVNETDCMNALGAANHEVMLSAYGDKDNHTYAEYMAAQNNVRDFDIDSSNGVFSEKARDYIRLHNATYGQSIEQAEQGINRLINYFPKEKEALLKKQQDYNLEGRRVASQYASSSQLENRIKSAAGESLEGYGLGTLKTSDINRAMKLAGRLKKALAEQDALAHRPIAESWLGRSATSVEPADMRNIPWRKRTLPNGKEDTAATIQSFKQSTAEMNGAVSIADGIEPGVTLDDYKEIVAKARKDLTALYKEAGLAKGRKGKIPTSEIDAFGDKIIESYSTIARANGSGIASDLINLNSAARDNTENAFISVASQTYSDSARATYDAQTEILNQRTKSLERRIKSAEKKAAREAAQQKLGQTMSGKITANVVKANPDKVFLFGDNVEDARTGYVPTSTQAVIRGQENAIGIPTKKNRGTRKDSYYTDADFDEFKRGVDDAIDAAKRTGKTIIIPKDGIGTGKAELETRAPKCFEYLTSQLDALKNTDKPTINEPATLEAIEGTYEVSTAGDKRFSALNAKFNSDKSIILHGHELKGLTVEQAYQLLKGSGKGKAPAEDSQIGIMTSNAERMAGRKLTKAEKEEISLKAYTEIWRAWAKENPDAISDLREKAAGRKLTDKFAKTKVTQAAALETVLAETDPLRTPTYAYSVDGEEYGEKYYKPEDLKKAVNETIGYDNLDSTSKLLFESYQDTIKKKTAEVEASPEYKKLLDEAERMDSENEENHRASDAYYADMGIYSDDELYSGEWETDSAAMLNDFIEEKVYTKDVLKQRDELIQTIERNLTNERGARLERYNSIIEDANRAIPVSELETNDMPGLNSDMTDAEVDAAVTEYRLKGWLDDITIREYNGWKTAPSKLIKEQMREALESAVFYDLYKEPWHSVEVEALFQEKAMEQARRGIGVNVPVMYDGVKSKYVDVGDGKLTPVDYEIADGVAALNVLGYETWMSCSGVGSDHPKEGGTEGFIIFSDPDEEHLKNIKNAAKQAGLRMGPDMDSRVSAKGLDDTAKITAWNTFFEALGVKSATKKLAKADAVSDAQQTATVSPVNVLKQQLADNIKTLNKHKLLDVEAGIRNGKSHFYTDQQILSGEFGRSDINVKATYRGSNWPEGLEIGEGNVTYTVNPSEDGVDIFKAGSEEQVSSTKLKQYLFDKAEDARERFGDSYEDFRIDSRNFVDNGDGTYTIYGRYGTGDMTLQEQEEVKISRWENLNMTDIDAEKRAILELSTMPIYESYDEMIDLAKYKKLVDQRAKLSEEYYDQDAITTINSLRKTAYDQYLQLTNALGKEYLDSLDAAKKYQTAVSKERKAYKVDDVDEQTVKSTLSRAEYDKYIEAKETLYNVARFLDSSDSGVYHAKNGVVFAKDGYAPTGFVDTKIAKAILEGRAIDTSEMSDEELAAELNSKENRKARKEMQKDINKNQNKGSIHYKNTEEYKAIRNSAMDKMSARYTLNNYIQFENQTRDMLTGMGLADEYKILMDKDYSDMMQRVAGKDGGSENDGVKAKFFDLMMHTANLNKTIQDWQLAGGFSNYNAATIAQIRGAIFNDPRMALEYLKVFTAAKNSNSTMDWVVQNREFLYKMVAKTGAGEIVTDLNQAISTTPGEGDVGTINSLTNRILSHLDGSREIEGRNKVSRGFGRIADDMNAMFSDATFVNTLPLFKARMLQINYDEALRYLKKFKGFEKMSADDIDDAAMWMSYAKTTDFLEPRKTRGSSWDDFTKNIANEEIRKAVASWTGAKRDASLMDNASTVFFALRWKMTFGGRVLNGLTNTPGALIRKMRLRNADISDPDTMAMASRQFMRSGNTMGVSVMIALSSLAMMWNKSLGYDSVSWDDLNIIGPDGEFQVPNILLKFQTLGQFWLPNTTDENGNLAIDPTKRMYGLDPFSSIFTMSNTAARTVDKLFNPNAYQKTPQRGLPFTQSSSDPINQFINSPFVRAFGDELIGSNLLSPYKAMYEVLVDDTYFGNNIWEKPKLADGTENPNYDPFRNVVASFAHILNWDWMLSGGTNKWVKNYGSPDYENSGKIGTVAGSGVFQHEFITAAINIMNGEALDGIIEAGELPIKTKNISGSARTDFNIRVKNIITQYVQEYKDKVGELHGVDAKNAEYAKLVKKCADVVADWSAKNKYVLGKDQELVAYVTKTLMAICAGEYNDNLDYVQNAYWKAHEIAKIEQSEELFLSDPDLDRFIAEGKTAKEFAEEKNRRSEAYNQAVDDEYQARVALKEAGIPDSWLTAYEDAYGDKSKSDFKSQMRAVNKQVFTEIHGVLEQQIGEFKNFKEMKEYYEAQIEAASTTKQKAKLANKYNDILTEAIAPYVHKYGAAILSDGYYNNQNLANSIAEYVILPADQYYYGKTPRASYLRDLFHVGYRDNSALPSDKEVYEKYTGALKKVHEGASATAAAMLDRLIRDYKDGRIYISDYDYSRIIRMKAQLNARSKQ